MQKDPKLMEVLTPIQDPELLMSIVELGLVYGVEQVGDVIKVELTLTSPACPLGPEIIAAVEQTLGQLEGVKRVDVQLVFIPPWNPREHCSEDAKMKLGIF